MYNVLPSAIDDGNAGRSKFTDILFPDLCRRRNGWSFTTRRGDDEWPNHPCAMRQTCRYESPLGISVVRTFTRAGRCRTFRAQYSSATAVELTGANRSLVLKRFALTILWSIAGMNLLTHLAPLAGTQSDAVRPVTLDDIRYLFANPASAQRDIESSRGDGQLAVHCPGLLATRFTHDSSYPR